MGEVGFGIVGTGMMGRTYAEALAKQVPDGRLVAVAEGSRAAQLAADYEVDLEPDAAAILARDDIDAVVIATPHSTHRPLAVAAAAHGKHVYLEKPMALDTAECDAIVEACRSAGVLLTVAKQARYNDINRLAREWISDGRIGELRMFRVLSATTGWDVPHNHWISDPREGGAYLDWGAHGTDALRYFSGQEATAAYATMHNFSGEYAPDLSAMVQYTLGEHTMAQVWMSYEFPPPGLGLNFQFLIVGSRAMIDLDRDHLRIGEGDGWRTELELPGWDWLVDPTNERRISLTARQVEEFAVAVQGGPPPGVTGADGRAAIEMIEAARRSSRTGEAVRLPLTGPLGTASAGASHAAVD